MQISSNRIEQQRDSLRNG